MGVVGVGSVGKPTPWAKSAASITQSASTTRASQRRFAPGRRCWSCSCTRPAGNELGSTSGSTA
eukprot:620972-Prymnesium_polylepis.2